MEETTLTNKDYLNLTAKIQRAKRYVEGWKTNISKWRNLYDSKHYRIISKKEPQYNDPTHTNTVDLAVGIMLKNKIRWHAYGDSTSREEQIDTGKIEKLMEGIWFVNDQREEKFNLYELFLNFCRDGGGIIYSVFDPITAQDSLDMIEMVDPESEQGTVTSPVFSEPPITTQIIDPTKVFALPGGPKRWLLIGRSEKMTIQDVETLYGINIPKFSHLDPFEKSITEGEFIDVWDYVNGTDGKIAVRNTVIFEDYPIKGPDIMKGYKELPYSIQFFKPTKSDPEGWHNIMTAMESSVELLEKLVNRRSHQIDVYTGLPIVSKTQPGRVVQVDKGLFNHVQISTDETIEFPQWPGNAPDVQLQVEFIRTRVNQSGFSDVMYGNGSGEAAGYAMSQQSDMNRIRLEQPIYHLQLLLTTWAKKTIDLLSVYAKGTSICVYGHHRGKDYKDYVKIDDLKGYAIRAEIRPHFPAEESRKVAMGSQAKGILSDYTLMERFFDIEQPEDEQERKMIEAASMNPLVVEYTVRAELQARADEGDQIAAQVLQAMQNGMNQTAGRDKEAPNPVQFSGMASPTGALTSQEGGNPPAGQSAFDQIAKQANARPGMK